MWLVDLRICFYLKRASSWLSFKVKFNWFFQRALVGFKNLWIHFIFREIHCVSVSEIPSPIIQMEISARYLGGCIFWFTFIFLLLSSRYGFFFHTFTYFVSFGVIENGVTKANFRYFNGNFAGAWLFEKLIFELIASSYSFKITCILSRQVISLRWCHQQNLPS